MHIKQSPENADYDLVYAVKMNNHPKNTPDYMTQVLNFLLQICHDPF